MKNRIAPKGILTFPSLVAAAMLGVGLSQPAFTMPARRQSLAAYSETLPGTVVKIKMVPIPGGSIHISKITVQVKPFYMATTETPWEVYDAFLSSGPPSKPYDQTKFAPDAIARPSRSYILPDLGWGHHGFPAINVSFTSVEMFCRWLASTTHKKYRVPTEAEWELACRDGMGDSWKITPSQLNKTAWYAANSEEMTHPVGTKAPSKLGLYDILGNVGEWATDLDGKPVLCGGSYLDPAALQSPLTRKRWSPKWQETDPQIPKSRWWLADGSFVGFRIVCEP